MAKRTKYKTKIIPCFIGEKGCWLWGGGKRKGYPVVTINKKSLYLSRVILSIKLGRPVVNSMEACHTCDVTECVNPDHLWEGTTKDNAKDKVNKGRMKVLRGEDNGSSKLTQEQVLQIRALVKNSGMPQWEIAERFNIKQQQVSRINTKTRWKHVA